MVKIHNSFSLYFYHLNQYLIKSFFLHSFLYILEYIIIITQLLEIFNNKFNNNNAQHEIKLNLPLKLLNILNMNETVLFFIIIVFILIFDILK